MTAKLIYGRARTGLLFIDPHNDFLSEGDKLWPRVPPIRSHTRTNRSRPQRRPAGAKLRRLFAISVSSLALLSRDTASAQTGTSPVVYEFGRPARTDEHTYDWYRRTHAEAASARYGEQLFAAGYAACFLSSMQLLASQGRARGAGGCRGGGHSRVRAAL
jgi:hypothetical protein